MKKAIIVGAGPAGLTAAYELITRTNIKPIILEQSNEVGGISRTVVYKGNRIDIGGHRFFSKSDAVMKWWLNILPLELEVEDEKADSDKVMLLRNRISRIFFLRKFFNYPISINFETITSLGLIRIVRILWSYFIIQLHPIKKEKSLEDFFINRFGKELYKTFFKDYTEKVWGVPCSQISASWGSQRIKELSILRTLLHAIKSIYKNDNSIEQKSLDTSLIEQFMYPKFGPGQMWASVLEIILEKGGEVIFNANVNKLLFGDKGIKEVGYLDEDKESILLIGDFFFLQCQ